MAQYIFHTAFQIEDTSVTHEKRRSLELGRLAFYNEMIEKKK